MKNIRFIISIIVCLALLVAAIPLLTACGEDTEGKTVKIGISTPSTGPAAGKGRPLEHGQKDAIEYINAELGGVNGYQLEMVWRDNGYDAASMSNIIRNFMDEGCVMFSTSSSAMMTASMGLANQNGIAGLAAFSSPNLYRPPQHIYGQLPDYGDDFLAFMKYYLDNVWEGTGIPKVAIHALNNSTGKGAIDAARAFAAQMGIEILWDGAEGKAFEHTTTTISEIESLTRIKAMNPDVLYISSTPAPTALLIKNARELGMNVAIASGHAGYTLTLLETAGADAEGVYGVFPTVSWGDDVPGMAKVVEYCEKNHPEDAGNGDYITGWAQSLIMAKIVETALDNAGYDVLAAGGLEAWEALEEEGIKKLKNYDVDGLHGPASYTEGDNRLSKSVRVLQVQSGVIEALTDWIEAPVVKYEDFAWFGQ
ncbi:MAG: ABC transporter substrate-binding protein [Dehalococcoidales bacterium]|nr:ABC transporter substrate-binding protein [Dehalococcoidales bacterium]